MNNKTDQIKDAIEKIVGKELDTFIVLGFNEEGYTLKAGRGETPAIAVLIADLYKQIPSLEQMVKTTQQLDEGKLPDDLVKALFNMLGVTIMNNQNQVVSNPSKSNSITDDVLKRVNEMKKDDGFLLPKGYSAENALKSAYLVLQGVKDRNKRPALEVCTRPSIANTLLNMVIQGLSPAKTQCYFIVYGNELQMQRSYFGTVAVLKRLDSVKNITAQVVHEGDKFEIGSDENFQTVVKEFQPSIENQDKEIAYAFARIFKNDGTYVDTIMTKKEIDQSWAQTRQKNNKVQQNFSQEMAKRTVLNRAAKMFINTSDDSDLLTGAINDTTSNEYDDERRDVTPVEDEKQSTDELLEGFQKSQEAKAKGVINNGNSNDGKEEANEEVADGQTELFDNGTIKPADEADS